MTTKSINNKKRIYIKRSTIYEEVAQKLKEEKKQNEKKERRKKFKLVKNKQ